MSNDIHFEGYIVLHNERGIVPIEVRYDGEFVSIWMDETYHDDIEDKAYLVDEYGDSFYRTFSDARLDERRLTIEDVWPHA